MSKSRSISQGHIRAISLRLRLFWQSRQSAALSSEVRARRFATGRAPNGELQAGPGTVARHFRSSAQPKLQAAKGVPGSGSGAFIWELLSHMVPDCDCAADLGDICKIVKGGLEL